MDLDSWWYVFRCAARQTFVALAVAGLVCACGSTSSSRQVTPATVIPTVVNSPQANPGSLTFELKITGNVDPGTSLTLEVSLGAGQTRRLPFCGISQAAPLEPCASGRGYLVSVSGPMHPGTGQWQLQRVVDGAEPKQAPPIVRAGTVSLSGDYVEIRYP